MPIISIIMPVYNSEKYIETAINSVLKQSFSDFELILVDDGSTDKSGEICDRYKNLDNRIIVIHKKNGGISSARNKGMEMSNGEYVAFIDNDDEYLSGLLEENIKLLMENKADVIKFNRIKLQYENEERYIVIDQPKNNNKEKVLLLEGQELQKSFLYLRKLSLLIYVWTGIFRKDIIIQNQIKFDESSRYGGEDILFNLEIFRHAKRYLINFNTYYKYNKRNFHSISEKFNLNRIESKIKILELTKTILMENNEIMEREAEWFEIQIEGLIGIIVYMSNKNCSYNIKQKIEYLKELKISSVINKRYTKKIINTKKNFKFNMKLIVAFLYFNNFYGILLIIFKIYTLLSYIMKK